MNMNVPNSKQAPPTAGEALWRNAFFYFSALMGALALVDFDAGRLAPGMGDLGVACMMLSLMSQFPFVRAVVTGGTGGAGPQARERLVAEAERFRAEHPWAERFSRAGWTLLLSSLLLRVIGLG